MFFFDFKRMPSLVYTLLPKQPKRMCIGNITD